MKRIIAVLLCFAILFTLAGCKKGEEDISDEVQYEYIEEIEETVGGEGTSTQNGSSGDSNSTFEPDSTPSDSTTTTNGTPIDYNTTAEIDICTDVIRGYLEAKDPTQQFFFLNQYQSSTSEDYQNLDISWSNDGSSKYTIYISEKADFSDAYITTIGATEGSVKDAICIPGKTYYWKAVGEKSNNPVGGGKFHVKDAPVRYIYLHGVGNVRDIGGWTTESGKKVPYGKIYRGKAINSITENGLKTLKALNIKTEIDIRADRNNPSATPNSGLDYHYIQNVDLQYDYIFSSSRQQAAREYYKAVFNILSDPDSYPIYTHCTAGADRTGTLIFLLNGLLGVSYEDLTRDFELTSFSSSGKRWRGNGDGGTFAANDLQMDVEGNYVAWGLLYNEMMTQYGTGDGKLSSAIERYLTTYAAVPQSQINSFKQIMLG